MTAAVIALAVLLFMCLVLLSRATAEHRRMIERLLAAQARERQAALEERRSLADRIQHPERIQVQPVEGPEPYVPRDSAELAYVGQLVPEFVQVGSPDPSNNSVSSEEQG